MFSLKPEHPKPCPARVFDSPRGSYPDAVHVALSASFRPGLTQVSHLRFEPFTRGATRPKNTQFTIYTHFPLPYRPYTTPTPDFPEFRKFRNFRLIFERDSCIRTPIFRWTPLPEAIPSRRKTPDFGQIFSGTPQFNNHQPVLYVVSHTPFILTKVCNQTYRSPYICHKPLPEPHQLIVNAQHHYRHIM